MVSVLGSRPTTWSVNFAEYVNARESIRQWSLEASNRARLRQSDHVGQRKDGSDSCVEYQLLFIDRMRKHWITITHMSHRKENLIYFYVSLLMHQLTTEAFEWWSFAVPGEEAM